MRFVHLADDSTVFASDSDINNVHASVNRELVGVDNWLKTSGLPLNVNKTSYIIIPNQNNALDIKIRERKHYESFNSQILWCYAR